MKNFEPNDNKLIESPEMTGQGNIYCSIVSNQEVWTDSQIIL